MRAIYLGSSGVGVQLEVCRPEVKWPAMDRDPEVCRPGYRLQGLRIPIEHRIPGLRVHRDLVPGVLRSNARLSDDPRWWGRRAVDLATLEPRRPLSRR
jgi:hypothetical protein